MIAVVGLDHHRASVEARGRVSFAGDQLAAALQALSRDEAVDEVVILSTCNRTEIYLASQHPDVALQSACRLLAETYAETGAPAPAHTTTRIATEIQPELADALYTYEGVAAAQRLYEVAAGLRSMVVGEPQILGQVRAALATAESERVVGEEMRSLFTGALKIGKRVRTETDINRADVSVAGLGVRAARLALDALSDKTVLLIGAGRTNQLTGELLRAEGVGQVFVANRSRESAVALAERLDGRALALDDVEAVLGGIDVLFSATAAPQIVVSEEMIARGRTDQRQPLLVIDLAVPSDVAAEVGALPGVTLITLDTLRDQADPGAHADPAVAESLRGHADDIAHAHQIIAEGLRDYTRAQTMRLAVPGIAALRQHVDQSEEEELARALAQLSHLSERDREIIERFGSRLVDKMFHHLVRRIRSLAEYDEIPPEVTMRVLAQLFAEPPSSNRE